MGRDRNRPGGTVARMTRTATTRVVLAAAAVAAAFGGSAPATAEAPCVRTAGNPYWEVCVNRDGCLVYVWSTMPPVVCL